MKKYFFIAALLCMFTMTSCLKDDPLFDWSAMKSVIELPYLQHNVRVSKVSPVEEVSFDLYVNYTVPYASDNKEDIKVTLGIDEDLLDSYNASLGSSGTYEILPAANYSLPDVLIKKGERLFSTKLNVKTDGLDAGKKYIIPVVIESVPDGYTKSGNFGYVHFRVDME